jgi:hypothetical protein
MNRLFFTIILAILLSLDIFTYEYQTFNLDKKEKIVIVINSPDKVFYNEFLEFITYEKENIPYEIDLIGTMDNFNSDNYLELEEYLEEYLLKTPDYAIYLNSHNQYTARDLSNSKKRLLPLEIQKYVSSFLGNSLEVANKIPLFFLGINKSHKISDIFNLRDTSVLILDGDIDFINFLSPLITRKIEVSSLYLAVPLGKRAIFLGEKQVLFIVLAFIIILFSLISIYSKRIIFHIKTNIPYIGTLLLKAMVVFIFLYISGEGINGIMGIFNNTTLIENYPKSVFTIKIFILLFMYGVCFHVIKDNNFSKSPYFYSYIAFFLGVLSFIFLLFISIPLALFQIIPIIFTILFISSRARSSKNFFLITSPLLLIYFFYRYLNQSNPDFVTLFIISRYKGNVLLTLILLPYLFLQDSYHRFVTRRQNKIIYKKDIVQSIITITFIFTYMAILLEFDKI